MRIQRQPYVQISFFDASSYFTPHICMCACLCVRVDKNAANVLELKISIRYLDHDWYQGSPKIKFLLWSTDNRPWCSPSLYHVAFTIKREVTRQERESLHSDHMLNMVAAIQFEYFKQRGGSNGENSSCLVYYFTCDWQLYLLSYWWRHGLSIWWIF